MKKLFTFSLILFCVLLVSPKLYATQKIGGADLHYTHVSGNTYTITLVIYGKCGSTVLETFTEATPQICIYSHDSVVTNIALAIQSPDSGVEVTPLCPGDTSQCTSTSSTIPGIKKYVYSANYTVPYMSNDWQFIFNGYMGSVAPAAGREAAITNLYSPGSTIMQLTAMLDNLGITNSSPALNTVPQFFFCIDTTNAYNPTAVDPDGDSLVVGVTNPYNGLGSTDCNSVNSIVSYASGGEAWSGQPLSAATPLQDVLPPPSYSYDSVSGAMAFYPTVLQNSIMVYNIKEYRSGTLVGTSQREMEVIVITCGSTFPCVGISGIAAIPASKHNVSVFPNPAYDELTIKMDEGAYSSFTICNNIGQTLRQQKLSATQTEVDVKALPAGVYYITFNGTYGTSVQKFVKM